MAYFAEYTDTFGGETNYSWVRRAAFKMPEGATKRSILQRARKELGLTGAKGDVTADFGDEYHWVPRGCCTILMVRWSDNPHEVGELADA